MSHRICAGPDRWNRCVTGSKNAATTKVMHDGHRENMSIAINDKDKKSF